MRTRINLLGFAHRTDLASTDVPAFRTNWSMWARIVAVDEVDADFVLFFAKLDSWLDGLTAASIS
ncbi:hypothetical protein [Aestuariivita sp.]|jgi:hypothetical protein|uniref:hypothetical protein n=1 Tax=Aestuariivita sp. TaxID=1872407 RepID=UPI002172021E|nr:hypothetical protein [Aestuariivita sp.]MCE8005805.1 hypothetical protein [Aestuariivita sp.]